MMTKLLRYTSVPLFLILLSGCASVTPKVTPEILQKDHSLVTGRIDWIDWRGNSGVPKVANLRIEGKYYYGVVKDGYFMVALPPGKYKFEHVQHTDYNTTYTKPIKKTIDVTAGKNLNIGLIVLVFNRKSTDNRYNIYAIDNIDEMKQYLKHKQGEIWKTIRNREFELANFKYVDDKTLNRIRQEIAIRKIVRNRWLFRNAAGPFGTLAYLDTKNKKKAKVRVVDTNTFRNFQNCYNRRKDITCQISDLDGNNRLMYFAGDRPEYRDLPTGFSVKNIYVSKTGTTILVDKDLRVLTSTNRKGAWSIQEEYTLKKSLKSYEQINFHKGKNGIYINTGNKFGTILFRNNKSGAYEKIPAVKDKVNMWNVLETEAGLFVGASSTGLSQKHFLYFQKKGTTTWHKRVLPAKYCNKVIYRGLKDKSGISLSTYCDSRTYSTSDGGLNWKEIKRKKKKT